MKRLLTYAALLFLIVSLPGQYVYAASVPEDASEQIEQNVEEKEENNNGTDNGNENEIHTGNCKESDKQLICEIDGKNYFYTIVGSSTPVYKGILDYDGDITVLSTEDLISLIQLKVYDHDQKILVDYDGDVIVEKTGDNKYSLELALLNGTHLKLPLTINSAEETINIPVVFNNISTQYMNNKKFFFLSLASVFVLFSGFKIALDYSIE